MVLSSKVPYIRNPCFENIQNLLSRYFYFPFVSLFPLGLRISSCAIIVKLSTKSCIIAEEYSASGITFYLPIVYFKAEEFLFLSQIPQPVDLRGCNALFGSYWHINCHKIFYYCYFLETTIASIHNILQDIAVYLFDCRALCIKDNTYIYKSLSKWHEKLTVISVNIINTFITFRSSNIFFHMSIIHSELFVHRSFHFDLLYGLKFNDVMLHGNQ